MIRTGIKWISPLGSFAKFDGTTWTEYNTSLSLYLTSSIEIDNNDLKWVGTKGGGLFSFDGTILATYDTTTSGIPSDMVYDVKIDQNGSKWIATDKGLAVFDDKNWLVYNISNSGLPYNVINAIAIAPDGDKWIGTENGLAQFDGTNWTIYNTSNSGIPYDEIISVSVDNTGKFGSELTED